MTRRLPPLLLHLVFHPESERAREIARAVHRALNADANIPGLRIPTVFCAENSNHVPPTSQQLDRAERSLVIPLADTDMNADDNWCSFVADLWYECEGSMHRCIPVQLTADAWPLHHRLNGVNFVRAFDYAEQELADFVIRRLIIELCRYLHGEQFQFKNPQAPIKLFLSHTKMDLQQSPQVVRLLKEYLSVDQPIDVWFDSGDIPGGSAFAREIEKGIKDTSLLCVRTDNYSSREWCRKEILLAKKHQRPMVVVNALNGQETRSFPYLGNAPEIRWWGKAEQVVDLVMKETLRHLHSRLILDGNSREDDVILLQAPELLTITDLPKGTHVLYPDPPLGKEELLALSSNQLCIETPLERMANHKSLSGKRIAISVSECPDIARHGLDNLHFRDALQDLTRYLLIKGATMLYGGHLAFEGFANQLMNMVVEHNRAEGVDPFELIENYIGWPLPYNKQHKIKVKGGAVLVRVERPIGINETLAPELIASPEFFAADISPIHRYAWARGMTAMREKQTTASQARIVIGGTTGAVLKLQADGREQIKWYASRIPGVLEEVIMSLKHNQPVFIIGAFGGVAGMIVDILENGRPEEMSWEYQKQAPHAVELRKLYQQRGDTWWSYDEMYEFVLEKGISGLNPGLSEEQHKELFHTTDAMRMVELVIAGLDELDQLGLLD